MLTLLFWCATAAATAPGDFVLGTLGLLHLAHRLDRGGKIPADDPDRDLARAYLKSANYPGRVGRAEVGVRLIQTQPLDPGERTLKAAFNHDGLHGDWYEIAERLAINLTEVPRRRGWDLDALARDLASHVLTPSRATDVVMSASFLDVQLDLIVALGRTGSPAAVTCLRQIASEVFRHWNRPWHKTEMLAVIMALKQIDPAQTFVIIGQVLRELVDEEQLTPDERDALEHELRDRFCDVRLGGGDPEPDEPDAPRR